MSNSLVAISPEKKIGVVILSNSAEGRRIYDNIAGAALKLAIEARTDKSIEKREYKITPPDKIVSEEMLQALVGRYANKNLIGSIERNKKTLNAQVGGYKVQLIPSSNGEFGVERKWFGPFSQKKIGDLELTKIRARRIC